MKDAYIFDMDGVLVNSEAYYHKLRLGFLKKFDLVMPYTDINDYLGIDYEVEWERLVQDPKQRSLLLPEFNKYWSENSINYQRYLNDQVPEFLTDLKHAGKSVALASAGVIRRIDQMLDECNLRQYFDSVISGENVNNNKPAPDIYLQSVQKLGLRSEQCVVIEDSTIGISAAKSAGIKTWAVKYPQYKIDQGQADRVFAGFGPLRQHFKNID